MKNMTLKEWLKWRAKLGGLVGGKSKSDKKRRSSQLNAIKAQAALREKREKIKKDKQNSIKIK